MLNIAIIGAGLSGLVIAQQLKSRANITVFEKARGVGGRLATRRAEPFSFDHGAQFFTVHSEAFKTFLQPLIEKQIIQHWPARFVELDYQNIHHSSQWQLSYPHYVGVPGMNAMAKALAEDLPIRLNTNVSKLQKAKSWQLFDDQQQRLGEFDWVIVTAPAAQTAKLLPTEFAYYEFIKQTQMQACFSLMLGFTTPLSLAFDAALVRGADISWISVNSSKPQRCNDFSLLVHATNDWADQHIDDDQSSVMQYLIGQTSEVIQHDVSCANHQAIHAWRYANIKKQPTQQVFIDDNHQLAACGDWCLQGRVEAAFSSAMACATQLKQGLE